MPKFFLHITISSYLIVNMMIRIFYLSCETALAQPCPSPCDSISCGRILGEPLATALLTVVAPSTTVCASPLSALFMRAASLAAVYCGTSQSIAFFFVRFRTL